ncbi:hypothetical protein WJX79_005466 [Trebouxia sp. C0005]
MPALQAFQGDSAADLASRVPFSAKTDIEVLMQQYVESSQPEKQEPVEDVTPKDPTWGLHETVTEIDSRDAATPDKWVPRHPRLVRLTGRHPFNCEPPLPDLMDRGFITPTALQYVRNHGAVPKLAWDTHNITVTGMVDKPMTFSMNDLKTKGFNWGASGTGTGWWTGVRLVDLLKYCGVHSYRQGARHVHFNGVEKELPQGTNGSYGTSLIYGTALNPANDILIAYKHNGKLLAPDHGFPVRMIIPGGIGGRMVKWLANIEVLATESDNFYHQHDNKVLPAGIEMEQANAEDWWSKSDFVLNELNVQSVVTAPAHDEMIPLSASGTYTVKGFAYSGGGRKLTRVEVSLDKAKTWLISNIIRHEEPTEHGKYWCWVFWEVEVPILDLLKADEICSRAVDISNNLQPQNLTWNLLGMLSNTFFRIKMQPKANREGQLCLYCEHPTKSGGEPGGWMEREAMASGGMAAVTEKQAVASTNVDTSKLKTYTLEEVEKHDSREDVWFVHDGKVYDGTKFLSAHPGGAESILMVGGQDATEEFNAIHSSKAKAMLADYMIGLIGNKTESKDDIAPERAPIDKQEMSDEGKLGMGGGGHSSTKIALNPKKKIPFKLSEKIALSHNTRLFRFALQTPEHTLGLPIGQHMFFYAKEKGEMVMRAYTPTSSDDEVGYFDLVVKVYFANNNPAFPLGGRMTQFMEKMAIGDTIDVKGPLGHFIYKGRGVYSHHGKEGKVKQMSMIAGGTGITPMWQVVQAVLKDPEDPTMMKLIFANQTHEDILMEKDLDALAQDQRFSIHYLLSRPKDGKYEKGSVGRVTEKLIKEQCFGSSDTTLCLLCGPQGMIDQACLPALDRLGYIKDNIVIF